MLLIDNGGRCYLVETKLREFIGYIERDGFGWIFYGFNFDSEHSSATRDELIEWIIETYTN